MSLPKLEKGEKWIWIMQNILIPYKMLLTATSSLQSVSSSKEPTSTQHQEDSDDKYVKTVADQLRAFQKRNKWKVKLDEEVDNFELSLSDDGFDDEEWHILNNAVGRRQNNEEQEVLKIYSSSEDPDEEAEEDDGEENEKRNDEEMYRGGVGSDMNSDIEDKPKDDGLPDSRAWGSEKKQYYDTDYVDKDYLGFDDEEAAIEEEKEANVIQRRLLYHLEGTDFPLGLLDEIEDKKKEAARRKEVLEDSEEEEKVEVDLSSLTHKEALKLLKRESPELFPLIKHCKSQLVFLKEKVWPILKMVDDGSLKECKAVELLELINKITLHYTLNVLFYLYAKENGELTNNNPVLQRFNAFKVLLQQMDVLLQQINPQIDMILEAKENNEDLVLKEEEPEPAPKNRKEKRKRKLEFLKKKELASKINRGKKRRLDKLQKNGYIMDLESRLKKEEIKVQYKEEDEDDDEEEQKDKCGEASMEEDKRSVAFKILKNKGLTPKRKKNRNPRVKNRNKFKKAVRRRKGQFRDPKKEFYRYEGEIAGIKVDISKSIKFK